MPALRPIPHPARLLRYLFPIGAAVVFLVLVYNPPLLERILKYLFPDAVTHTYTRIPLSVMLADHLKLVIVSSVAATATGISLGVAVTRPWGRQFLPLAQSTVSLMQTMPPVAVLAIVTPLLGFGTLPTIAALYAFSILPVLNNTISGILAVPPAMRDVAYGMGMSAPQVLVRVELPLAARVISAGIRVSTVVNIGTATVGAIIGAGGFGVIIIAGLVRNNPAFILSGAVATSLFALLTNWLLKQVENGFYRSR